MMINFYNAFLDSAVVNQNVKNKKKLRALLNAKGLHDGLTAEAKPIIEQFAKDKPAT
jgi:hypothetical protein